MNEKDLYEGIRCWVAFGGKVDEYGQNATIERIFHVLHSGMINYVRVNTDKGEPVDRVPGQNMFWSQPVAPTRPKRKIVKSFAGAISRYGLDSLRQGRTVNVYQETDPIALYKCTITVTIEE